MALNFIQIRLFKIWISVFTVLVILHSCSSDDVDKQHNESKIESTKSSSNKKVIVDYNSIYSYAYNKTLLENYPLNIKFDSKPLIVNDTTYRMKGISSDGFLEAGIVYSPIDNQFYSLELTLKKIPLHPAKTDVQILKDFTNKFDVGFVNFFDRNFSGIFIDEDKFIDEGRYLNREKGFCFVTDGNVALNNMDIKKHPDMKDQIMEEGNYASVTIINLNKPYWLWSSANTWTTVEK